MPRNQARTVLEGEPGDHFTVGECHNEKELSSEVRSSSLSGLSDIPRSPNRRRCPSVKNRDLKSKMPPASSPLVYDMCHTLEVKTGVLFVLRYPGMPLPGRARSKEPKRTFFGGQSMRIWANGMQYADLEK
jgi:hypothetical protein